MKILNRILSMVIILPIIYFNFVIGSISLMEGKNIIHPYIDTEFAPNYTPEKFEMINTEYSYQDVKKLLGEPLFERHDSTTNEIELDYTNDGKVLSQELSTYLVPIQDFAWYRSSIRFNSEGKIIVIDSGWSYD